MFYKTLTLLVFLLCGCAGKAPEVVTVPEPPEGVGSQTVATSGLDVGLEAFETGGRIFINLQNNTPSSLEVSPFFFGIIIDNKKPAIKFTPDKGTSKFPVTTLASGMQATGFIRFRTYDKLKGQKLVFNSPDYKPIFTIIKGAVSEAVIK